MTTDEVLCDMRESTIEKYVTITYREGGETVREQHWIFPPDSAPYALRSPVRWDINTFKPGRGPLQVGDRVEYTGKGPKYVEDVPIGTKATVTKDHGFSYRYMFEFDAPTNMHIWERYPDGEYQGRTGMRTGGTGWTKITNEDEEG